MDVGRPPGAFRVMRNTAGAVFFGYFLLLPKESNIQTPVVRNDKKIPARYVERVFVCVEFS